MQDYFVRPVLRPSGRTSCVHKTLYEQSRTTLVGL